MESLAGCSEQSWWQSLCTIILSHCSVPRGKSRKKWQNQVISDSSSPKSPKHFSNHHMDHKTKCWFSPFIFSHMILYLEFSCCTTFWLTKTRAPYPQSGNKVHKMSCLSPAWLLPRACPLILIRSAVTNAALLSPECGFTAQNTLHVSPCVRVGRKGKFGLNVLLVI